ncbi:MAG: cytochrome c-type biogenesis protein [Hyphomicrobium sp.]
MCRLKICFSVTALRLAVALSFLTMFSPSAFAVQPDEVLSDRALETRARELSAELRCLVCQNQSIDDSDAPLARDLRVLVRERLATGSSDQEIRDYVVARYGEYVLLKPPLGWHTLLLWILPALVLAGAVMAAARLVKPAAPSAVASALARLSPEEEAKLKSIVERAGIDETGRD